LDRVVVALEIYLNLNLEEPVYDPATTDPSFPPPTKEQQDTVVVPDNWGGLFEETGHTSEERGLDLTADIVFTELESTVQIRISELEYLPMYLSCCEQSS
jgi:hypothetical protein